MMPSNYMRGEIVLIDLSDAAGLKPRKGRPSLVIQNDIGNVRSSVTIVAPVVEKLNPKMLPILVPVPVGEGGLKRPSVIDCGSLVTVHKGRIVRKLGRVSSETLRRVDVALGVSLGLSSTAEHQRIDVELLTRLVRQVGELSGSDFATPHRPARAKDLSHPTDTRPGAPGPETPQTPLPVEVLVQSAIVLHGPSVEDGALIQSVTVAWFEIIKQLDRDPHILSKIPPRKVEELIAGAYERAGWPEVILTPRSGDHGRDIIATKPGIGSIRIFDQIKAYSPGHVVTADEVRSMLGVLYAEKNVSKGVITTSSSFAPNLRKDTGLSAFLPHRLELKDGPELRRWLLDLLGQTSANE